MKKIIFNCVPPFRTDLPAAAFSVLKAWLAKYNINSSIIYWNLKLNNMQADFIRNYSGLLGISNDLSLYVSYLVHKSNNLFLYDSFKKILQAASPRFIGDNIGYYDDHIQRFSVKIDLLIENTLSKIDTTEVACWGFSMKLDGWIVSSIIAEKIKRIAPNIPIIIGGINTKKNAQAFLENFPQFDIAMWGEGEEPLRSLVKAICSNNNDYDSIPNIAYRRGNVVVFSKKTNNEFINLSESDFYPDYDDYFNEKKELKLNNTSIIPIEGSRGCHWNKCKFCYLNIGYKYRVKSIKKVCAEIKYMIKKYGVHKFQFFDNDFIGLDINKANEMLDSLVCIKQQDPSFEIVLVEVITKGLDRSIIAKIAEAGIKCVQIGYESPSNNLLRKINKKNTFASNLLFIKVAYLHSILLGSVNLIINMPEESTEDILEAIDNLKYLRFYLKDSQFKHFILPLEVSSSSKYYSNIKKYSESWSFSMPAYIFLKNFIDEKYHWDVFSYTKLTPDYHWHIFRQIEKYYIDNKYSYSIDKNNAVYQYREYINDRKINEIKFNEDSIDWLVLCCSNDMVISLQDLFVMIKDYIDESNIELDILQKTVGNLQKQGLLYYTSDFSEIISVINIPKKY